LSKTLENVIMRLSQQNVERAVNFSQLRRDKEAVEDKRNALHNQNITLRSNLENAVEAVANHAKGIQRLKDKNDKLNADIKTAAGLLRTIHTAGVLNNEDTKAVEEVLERLGYPIQLSVDVEGDIE